MIGQRLQSFTEARWSNCITYGSPDISNPGRNSGGYCSTHEKKTGPSSVIESQYRHFSKAIEYVPEGITDLCTPLNYVSIHSFNPSWRKANQSTSANPLLGVTQKRNQDNNISFSYPHWLSVDIGFQATGEEQFLENFILDLNLLVSQSVSLLTETNSLTWPTSCVWGKSLKLQKIKKKKKKKKKSTKCFILIGVSFFFSSLNHKTK